MTAPVVQSRLPEAPWLDPALWRLPGMKPLDPDLWLIQDDAFSGQMALRDGLIRDRRDEVYAFLPDAEAAAAECLDLVLRYCSDRTGYAVDGGVVVRPDQTRVSIDRDQPLLTIGRLIQEDICILQKDEAIGEHILTGAIVCFPASWTLGEKIGKPLSRIHTPVAQYDRDVAHRVQRMFDRLRPDTPMWRANALLYDESELFKPRRESDAVRHISKKGTFLRSERQTVRRLQKTGAIVFAIHTYVVPVSELSDKQRVALNRVAERHHASSEHPQ